MAKFQKGGSMPACTSSAVLRCLLLAVVLVCCSHLVLLGYNVADQSDSSLLMTSHIHSMDRTHQVGHTVAAAGTSTPKLPRVLAILFPQYHSDPLNDRLWGHGFNDWDNLKAAPKYNRLGFEIPRPTELGYYDLMNATTRKIQGDLAIQYGIDGFVYHHYWFYDPSHPGANLHAPLMNMLSDGYPDIPFLLNWCDSSWADTWLGRSKLSQSSGTGKNVLQAQFFPDPSDSAIVEHYKWLKQFFLHPKYIKVRDQPVFMIHQRKPSSYPILKQLRYLAVADGFPGLYFALGMSFTHAELFPEGRSQGQRRRYPKYIFNKTIAYPYPLSWMERKTLQVPSWCTYDSKTSPSKGTSGEVAGILTSFDNTPRRDLQSANLWSADHPDLVVRRFHDSLYAAIYYEACCLNEDQNESGTPGFEEGDDSFVIINSWNEWAEGMSLEPSTVFGRRLLDAVRRAKSAVITGGCKGKSAKRQ